MNRKPHQIVHLLTTGKIPEPQQRISNKRLFTEADITRLARHFKVTPKWAVMESTPDGGEDNASQGLVLKPPYEVVQVSETGHEVRDGDGMSSAGLPIAEGHWSWRVCWKQLLGTDPQRTRQIQKLDAVAGYVHGVHSDY